MSLVGIVLVRRMVVECVTKHIVDEVAEIIPLNVFRQWLCAAYDQIALIRTHCRLAQSEKCLFQSLTNRAVRLAKNNHLVLVEKVFAKAVKEMQEVAQESNAIENRNFDTSRFVIFGAGIF